MRAFVLDLLGSTAENVEGRKLTLEQLKGLTPDTRIHYLSQPWANYIKDHKEKLYWKRIKSVQVRVSLPRGARCSGGWPEHSYTEGRAWGNGLP